VAVIAVHIPSNRLLGTTFAAVAILLAIAAATILRRVIVSASRVDLRTILGTISVYTFLGLLFAFLYFAFGAGATPSSSPAYPTRRRATTSSSATRP
jgi:hypothetical protein